MGRDVVNDRGAVRREKPRRATGTPSRSTRIDEIQYLRGVAALLVVLQHAIFDLNDKLGYHVEMPLLSTEIGVYGVRIFFVISGFVIHHVSVNRLDSPSYAKQFLKSRIVRVIPLYWFYTMLFVLSVTIASRVINHASVTVAMVVKSLLFIPYARPGDAAMEPLLGVGWSLNYEVFFYAIFGACIFFSRRFASVALGLVIAIVVGVGSVSSPPSIFGFWGSQIILLFVAGVVLSAQFSRSKAVDVSTWASFVILAGVSVVMALVHVQLLPRPDLGSIVVRDFLCPVATVACAVFVRGKGKISAAALIGDSSYSLYLAHPFAINVAILALARFGLLRDGPLLSLGVLVAGSVAMGILSFYLLEKPATIWLVRRTDVPPPVIIAAE